MVSSLARRSTIYDQSGPSPDLAPPPTYILLSPDDTRIVVSDYTAISVRSASRLRFVRPIVDGFDYQHCSPGSRATIKTDATQVIFKAYYNDLIHGVGPRESTASILVDGVEHGTIVNPTGFTGPAYVNGSVSFLTAEDRTIELVWPYGDGMDLISIAINSGATLAAPPARPAGILAACGDSITHGFSAPKTIQTWAYKLAASKDRQVKNFANAGRTVVAADAGALIGSGADRVTYMIGYNDFLYQNAVPAFQAAVQGWIIAAKAALPSAKIYVISPIYSPNNNTIPLSTYRAAVQAAVAAEGGSNVAFIDGLALMTNNSAMLVDGVHPGAAGAAEIAAALGSIIAD